MGVFSALSKEVEDGLFDMTEFWKHSIGVGFAARKIAKKTGRISEESTVLVGLLHDIGKLIFSIYFPKEYEGVLERAAEQKIPLHQVEKASLGLDHAEMADLLMEQWKFPPDIVQAVRYHNNPSACRNGNSYMASIANTANFICHRSHIGRSRNKKTEKDNAVLEKLNLSYGAVSLLVEELSSEREQVDGFLEALS
jgi:putative nucleotidyltransferase with HDIG domain